MTSLRLIACAPLLALAACQGADSGAAGADSSQASAASDAPAPVPTASGTEAYDGIGPDETLRFTGTEPFWGGEVTRGTLRYATPENQDGSEIAVERFAGRGGIAYSGELDGAAFEMMVTPLDCSDGMSDRTYPFTVTLQLGEETRNGCGWTDRKPFEGPEHP